MFLRVTLFLCAGLFYGSSLPVFAETSGGDRPLLKNLRFRHVSPDAPKISDVCFSSRWPHPTEPSDPHRTPDAAKSFHATKVVWTYIGPKQEGYVADIHELGMTCQGAINTDVPASSAEAADAKKNLAGQTIPWRWGRVHLCPNAPATLPHLVQWAKRLMDQGVDEIQVDDWDFWAFCAIQLPHETKQRVEKCYCEHCIAGFTEYLKNKGPDVWKGAGIADIDSFDLRDYLRAHPREREGEERPVEKLYEEFGKASLTQFWEKFRSETEKSAGKKLVVSANNFGGIWQPIEGSFDYGIAELPEAVASPRYIYDTLNNLFQKGRGQVFSVMGRKIAETRRRIATITATGGNALVPWDIFMGPNQPRYFGQPFAYSDLYGFIRANAQYLDGYEDAAVFGPGIMDDRWAGEPPVRLDEGSEVFCLVRAKENDPSAPVAVHLVDWAETSAPFTVAIDTSKINPDAKYTFELLVPEPYQKDKHEIAQRTGDYGPLSKTIPLEATLDRGWAEIKVPALSPWGILLIKESKEP